MPQSKFTELGLFRSWQKARNQAVEPSDKKYLDALNALKIKHTKAGDLAAAIEVDAEIKKLTTVRESAAAQTQKAQKAPPSSPCFPNILQSRFLRKLTTSVGA